MIYLNSFYIHFRFIILLFYIHSTFILIYLTFFYSIYLYRLYYTVHLFMHQIYIDYSAYFLIIFTFPSHQIVNGNIEYSITAQASASLVCGGRAGVVRWNKGCQGSDYTGISTTCRKRCSLFFSSAIINRIEPRPLLITRTHVLLSCIEC